MSEHITLECLKLANQLLADSGLSQSTKLHHINELDRNFFKDLFASVFGQILPDDEESTAVFYRALLASLSDILSISLDHIDPIDVAKKDAVALYHLIELCLTYVQHLVDVDKGAAPSFTNISAGKLDYGKSDVDTTKREKSHSSGSNSSDTDALLKLGNENKYLKHRIDSELLLNAGSDENANVGDSRAFDSAPVAQTSVSVPKSKSRSRQVLAEGSTWENILQPYRTQPKVQNSRTKKVVRLEDKSAGAVPKKAMSRKEVPQKEQVDAGGRKRVQSSHHHQREKKHPGEKPLELEEYLQEEFPALDLPPDTVNLVEKKQQQQNRYIASNLGFYHTQRRLIQRQLTELEKQRKGILKSKRSELEHWNRREDERDAADVRIKTRAALRDERTTGARHRRMLKEEEQQRQRMLLAHNEDLVYRRTVDHILKSQKERLIEKKKQRVEDFQEKMTKALGDLDQLNRNYKEKITRITAEIMEDQRRDNSRGRARQLSWRERRRRLIKSTESTRRQVVGGAREAHYRKEDEERLRRDIDKAAFNFEVHDTDI